MDTNDIITAAAAIIRNFSADLATAWVAQPFRRVDIAHAFAAGFNGGDTSKDVAKPASYVLQVAYVDRDVRAALARHEALSA